MVRPFGVMLDNASICDPVWTPCLNRGQKIDFGVLNWRASKGNSLPEKLIALVKKLVDGVVPGSKEVLQGSFMEKLHLGYMQ